MVDQVRLRVSTPLPKVRLRVLPSLLPTQIELQNTGTVIQWRYIDGVSPWQDLITVLDLLPTPAEILAQLLTVDGSGSGLDADLLDGLDSSVFDRVAKTSQTINAAGSYTVADTTRIVKINLGSSGTVNLTLPKTANRAGADLAIYDFAGNANGAVTPDAADTGGIMGSSAWKFSSLQAGIGTAASIKLVPDNSVLGWLG
jgi:hypothetical protein